MTTNWYGGDYENCWELRDAWLSGKPGPPRKPPAGSRPCHLTSRSSILDVRLPDGTGIEVCRNVRSINPSLSCVILTSYDDDQAVRGAVLAGASGYILKEILGSDLVGKVLRAAAGESLFEPGMKERIIAGLHDPPEEDTRLVRLTRQEKKVLALIGEGMSNREIAGELFLAEKTIKNHVSSILAKLGFQRRVQAAVYISTSVDPSPC